jgi:hypothetical protein
MTSTQAVEDIVKSEYEHGFVTEIESDTLPPGLDEGVVRAISARKGEPEFMTEWRLKAYRHWLTMPTRTGRPSHYPRSISSRSPITRRPSAPRTCPRASTRSIRCCSRPTNKLGIPIEEQKGAGRDRRRRGLRQRLGRDDLSRRARRGRRHLLLHLRGRARASRAGQKYLGHGRSAHRQLLRLDSTRPSSATAPSSMCPRACAVRWS